MDAKSGYFFKPVTRLSPVQWSYGEYTIQDGNLGPRFSQGRARCTFSAFYDSCSVANNPRGVLAEQRLRMCGDRRGRGSKLVSFAKGFSKHPCILAISKVDSEYLRFPFKVKVDYFILYSILVSTFVIFLLLFSMNKSRRTNEASLQKVVSFAKGFSKHPHIFPIFKMVSKY